MIVGILALLAGCPHEPTTATAPAATAATAEAPTGPGAPAAVSSYTTTATGLKIADITVGTGAEVHAGDLIEVGYTGWLQGRASSFDTSYGRNTPFVITIGSGQVIEGWDVGVVGMHVGGKRQLVIPPALGYGERGAPPVIPPDATLVFDVEVVKVMGKRVAPDAPPACAATIKTESGLMYCDVRVGTGDLPKPGDFVSAEYTGWLADGTRFDSSYLRDGPIAFPVGTGRVIKGWDEGLSTMHAGGRRVLVVPPDLAYGASGRPPVIPPDATLTFEVELVGITPPAP